MFIKYLWNGKITEYSSFKITVNNERTDNKSKRIKSNLATFGKKGQKESKLVDWEKLIVNVESASGLPELETLN